MAGRRTVTETLARVHPDDRGPLLVNLRALLNGEQDEIRTEIRMRTFQESWLWVSASGKVLARDTSGRALHVVGTIADSDLRKRGEEQLYRIANFDALTGLPNRTLLEDRLERAIAEANFSTNSIALLFVDLDRFKYVNDSLGHQAGDELLRVVSSRLSGAAREVDTVARLGGDEFVIVRPNCGGSADAARFAAQLRALLEAPVRVAGKVLHLGLSIGISMYPCDGRDRQTLMRNASAAMNHAKELGRGGFQFFTADINEKATRRLGLESDLRRALASGEFELYYQPRVSLASGKVAGIEALLRWNRAHCGTLLPGDFIPLSEDTGLIVGIGEWVLREACRQLGEWRRRYPDLRVSVNLSARQLRSGDIHSLVADVVARCGIAPEALELEITESVLLEHTDAILHTLDRIAQLGVRFAVDDFGTGYSCLGSLRRLPLAAIKIDRSFVQGAATDSGDVAILRAMVGIADSLKLEVVAEGVETNAQLAAVRALGCGEAQGFYFSEPLDAGAMSQYLLKAA